MSISGMFLIMFLTIHLAINLTSLISREAYENACKFMDENLFIRLMVPILSLGFIVHIVMGFVLTIQNRRARPIDYKKKGRLSQVSWASKNMLALGLIVLGLLMIHLGHFWAKMQLQHFLGHEGENPYDLVKIVFSNYWYVAMYIVWILALYFHISHGFWSMFQSMGVTNIKWLPHLQLISKVYSVVIACGFMIIPIYFFCGFGEA